MISKKLAGMLILAAMLGTVNASHAISNTASQTLQCTLGTYLDITAQTSGAVTTTTITPDTGNLTAALVSKFKINLNTDSQDLYLQGKTTGAAGDVNALFKQGSQTYVVFSNTASGKVPTAAAIADCKTASPTATNNANAIAYPIASVVLDNGGTSNYDGTKNQYNINVNGGTTIATTTTGTTPYANTYSFQDNAGTYQAIMTLTSTSL